MLQNYNNHYLNMFRIKWFIINTNIPNYTIYTYHVTDMEQLADAIDDGYVVVYSDANIYQIRKQN